MDRLPPELIEIIFLRLGTRHALSLIKGGLRLPGLQDSLHLDLTSLHLGLATKCEHILLIANTFTRLRELRLGSGGCGGIHIHLSNLKNLTTLDVGGSWITDRCLREICQNCPLTNLDIEGCRSLTDFSPIVFLDNLKRLVIGGTHCSVLNLKWICEEFQNTLVFLSLCQMEHEDTLSDHEDEIKWTSISLLIKLRYLYTLYPFCDGGMKKLTKLAPSLEFLRLYDQDDTLLRTNNGCEMLGEFKRLKTLILSKVHILPEKFKSICTGATHIEQLHLRYCLYESLNSTPHITQLPHLKFFRCNHAVYQAMEINGVLNRLFKKRVMVIKWTSY